MNHFNRSKNRSRLFERGVALTLSVSMLLPTVAYGANGVSPTLPAQVKSDSEFPNIEIQTNFVRSEYGVLDGTMELALRAGPSVYAGDLYDDDNDPATPDVAATATIPVSFRTLSVNLEYDPTLYTPVSWTWTAGTDPDKANPADLDLNTDAFYSVDLPAKKNDLLPATGAIAKCGIVSTDPADPTAPTEGEGLVYFKAEAYNADLRLEEMTTLAVIRFKINDSLARRISIAPTDTGDYTVSVTKNDDTTMVVTNVDELHEALGRDLTATPADPAAVAFASDDDIHDKRPPVLMGLQFTGGSNQQLYYVPGCNKTDTVDAPGSSVVSVKVDGLNITIPGPKTENGRVLAVDKNETDDKKKYSYLSNHFDERAGHHHITWPVVSAVSFAYQAVDLSKYTTVVYVDWDNTLLGTQILPKGADVREMVNEYVSERFIYHNADNSENLVPNTVAETSSLTRADSYRGKYPITPQPLGANGLTTDPNNTVRLDGENYPLTNKLDYVFFKRPMEYDEKDENWKQKVDDKGNAIWDAKYPFAYGWAKCTVDNYADTWTTLGMGELSDYNGSSVGGYHKLDSGVLASFSYDSELFGFEMMDLQTGFQDGDNTVFLKAVYEPGEELLNSTNAYRQLKTPYYNKYNTLNASSGAAYQVEIVFERSYMDEATREIRGVARTREPVLRQETTTDMKWESLPAKNVVNDDMVNADTQSAYSDKDKSTYGRVDVSNSEIITASFALSGRQNKLDYYLVESYGSNFISAGRRTVTDNNRLDGGVSIVDNFYYYVDGIDESLYYATPKVESRYGTNGFVLYGTLNNIMEIATRYNHGEATVSDYYGALSMDNFSDANLRDADGNTVTGRTEEDVQNAISDAADKAEYEYVTNGNTDWWNEEKKCAELTYHQLQYYILTYTQGSPRSGTLLPDDTEANFQPEITWCNLHKHCVDQRSDTPDTWDKVIAAAREANGGNSAKMDLLNNLANLENLTRLRKDGNGGHYATVEELKTAICTAVAALDGTAGTVTHNWDAVQAQILGETATDGPEKYWWYDGVDSVPFTDWAAMRAAADGALDSPSMSIALPDGRPVRNRPAKLNQFEDTFDANAAAEVSNTNLSGTDPNWVKATENLVKDVAADDTTTDKFDDFDSFKKAMLDGLKAAYDSGETSPDWYQIQYMILNPTATFPMKNGETGAPTDYAGYWWHNGGTKITDLKSMVAAAAARSTGWSNFTYADMQALTGVADFRSTFGGSEYTEADFAAFKSNVEKYAAEDNDWNNITNLSALWDRVQYTLINGTYTASEVSREATFYWWKNGGTPSPVSVSTMDGTSPSTDADALAKILVEAAFRAKYNGNIKAYDNIDAAILEQGRLVDEINNTAEGAAYPTDFTPATLSTVESIAESLIAGMSVANYLAYVRDKNNNQTWGDVWQQIQSGLLTASGSSYADEYWWKSKDTLGPDPGATWNTLLGKIESFLTDDGTVTEADLQSYFTVAMAESIDMTPDGGSTFDDYGVTDFTDLPWAFIQGEGYTTLTWYQLQCLFVVHFSDGEEWTDSLYSPDDAESYVTGDYGISPPSWLPGGASFMPLRAPAMLMAAAVPAAPVTSTMTGEDGTETTTQSLTEIDEETGCIITTTMTTVMTPQENGVLVVETTTINTLDPATGKTWVEVLDTVVAFVPNEETEEPAAPSPNDPYGLGPDTIVIEGVEVPPSEETGEATEGEGSGDGEETSQAEPAQNPGSTMPEVVDREDVEGTEGEEAATDGTESPAPTEDEAPTESPVPTEGEEPTTSPVPTEGEEGTDPPPVVSTLASRQTRWYRTSIRRLKSPPWLRSPNIPRVTTRFVFDRPLAEQLILTYGRTPK